MKVLYEFNEEVDGDMDPLKVFQQAQKNHSSLWDIYQFCRTLLKHQDGIPERERAWLEEIRSKACLDDWKNLHFLPLYWDSKNFYSECM